MGSASSRISRVRGPQWHLWDAVPVIFHVCGPPGGRLCVERRQETAQASARWAPLWQNCLNYPGSSAHDEGMNRNHRFHPRKSKHLTSMLLNQNFTHSCFKHTNTYLMRIHTRNSLKAQVTTSNIMNQSNINQICMHVLTVLTR